MLFRSQITFAFFGAVALGLLVRFAGGGSVVASAGNLLGSLFVGALKAIAPLLVFTLVVSAVAQHRKGMNSNIRPVIVLYVVGMAVAALLYRLMRLFSADLMMSLKCRCLEN